MLIFTPVANLGLPENATHACDGTVRGSQREPTQVLGQHAVSTDLTTTVKKKRRKIKGKCNIKQPTGRFVVRQLNT